MTPRKVNAEIRQGVIFYVSDPTGRANHGLGLIAKKAKSVKRGEKTLVKVLTEAGWIETQYARRAGSESLILLEHEGVMTWAIN